MDQHPTTHTIGTPAWRWLLALALAFALAACGFDPTSTPVQGQAGGGGLSPELVAQNFFDDLSAALKDKQISNDTKRSKWVDQLASYFAPAERDDIKVALSTALDTYVDGLGKLGTNEAITLDVKYDRIETISEDGNRALVRPINGSIYLLITRTTETGAVITLWEQDDPLNKIIGNADGAVPAVRIGRTWFLSEG
ncbi:MAG TPA: hypothetical protein PLO33_01760 [Kouleothrix sp.]|uniref:hypothetical protein n=1 Tax=Kouleothrix sp. TaxID=2779161 RepID=UPI002BF42B6C|nr:hypothetical protein [Kouleothrix sp.]HRC74371.1 hypothetical protein [Kouleothrix sp.]